MKNCKIIDFKIKGDERGKLIPLEYPAQLPFAIERIYYIYDVPKSEHRGYHSHNNLEQILIAIHGSVTVLTETPNEREITILDSPNKGLYIGPMVWREMFDFSENAVLLVLASSIYKEEDYIRNKSEYFEIATEYYK